MSTSSSTEYGENIVINSDFNGNAKGWVLSGGMKYEDHNIVAEPSAIYVKKASQSLPVFAGEYYLVKYEVAITGSATSSFSLGNIFISHDDQQGTLSSIIRPDDNQPLIINVVVQSGKISISNVFVQEITMLISSSSISSSSSLSSYSSKSTSPTSYLKTTSSSVSSESSNSIIKTSSSSSSPSQSSQSISLSSSSLSSISSLSSLSLSSSTLSSSASSSSSISGSSVSSFSSSSMSSSSISSLSSSSLSSYSTRSSKSTSSSEILDTSSSFSSESSLSSSSSLRKGYFLVPFSFESLNGKQIWCFARNENYVYAGTGPYGKIIRSQDCYNWDDFETVNDSHIRSMFVWSNGLFVGTEPHGKIYVYNFSSEMFYNFVQTEDSCVTCFAEYNGKLYAGTSPLGVIYQFDGSVWSRVYQANGNGINSMVTYGNLLYIFSKNTEFAVTYDSSNFKIMPIRTIKDMGEELDLSSSSSSSLSYSSLSSSSSQELVKEAVVESSPSSSSSLSGAKENNKESFYSFRNSKYEPLVENHFFNRSTTDIQNSIAAGTLSPEDIDLLKPTIGVKSILSSCSGNSLYIGSDNGIIFSYPDDEKNVKILYQKDKGNVKQIINVGVGKVIVSIDNELYLIDSDAIVETDLIPKPKKK